MVLTKMNNEFITTAYSLSTNGIERLRCL